jgi:IclR family transcriptional regulator, pca regulon regulatory protein
MVKVLKSVSQKSTKRDSKSKNEAGSTPVKSIFRAANILQCLDNNIHSVKEIAANCQLSEATVHRILQTLEESGLVFLEPVEHKYYFGPLFTQLAINRVDVHKFLLTQAYDEVNRMADLFGEFSVFDVEVGMQVITLMQVPSRFNFSVSRLIKPTYYTSVSKMMMAQKSDAEIEIILKSIEIKPTSKYCVADKENLKEQFRQARRQGYFISRRESDEGVMGVSVPVKNYMCAAALSVVGPEIRLDPIIEKVTKELLASASRISDRLAKNK